MLKGAAGWQGEPRGTGLTDNSPLVPRKVSSLEAWRHAAWRVKLARMVGEAWCLRVNKADGARRSSLPRLDSHSSVLESPHAAFLSACYCCLRGTPLPTENKLMSSWNT